MHKRHFIQSIPVFVMIAMLLGCQSKQPLDPGADLLNNIFTFHELHIDSLRYMRGTVNIDYGKLTADPVGNYLDHQAKSLIKFSDLSNLDISGYDHLQNATLVLPVSGTIGDTTTGIGVNAYLYRDSWNDSTDYNLNSLMMYDPSESDLLDNLSYPSDADTTDRMRFAIDTTVIKMWKDGTLENNGILLQSPTNTGIVYGIGLESGQTLPTLSIAVVDTADSVHQVTIGASEDLGGITPGDIPAIDPNDTVIRQADGARVVVKFPGVTDSIPNTASFIHSASLIIPVDQSRSYTYSGKHLIGVDIQQSADTLRGTGTGAISDSVLATDSTLVVDYDLFRDFLQSYVDGSRNTDIGLVIRYNSEGLLVNHLYLETSRARLKIIYSDVEEK